MANLQKTLDALQPYVIGIRYVDGVPVVDTVFKDGWTLPESNFISKAKGNEEMNYYMLFSDKDGVGLDELLEYVSTTIKVNIEKEKKHELLKEKVNELKELFKRTSLIKLQRLSFTFAEEDLVPLIQELDMKEEPLDTEIQNTEIEVVPEHQEPEVQIPVQPMTDEEREILEEERRAENFRKYQQNQKSNKQLDQIKNKIELPPKKSFSESNLPADDACDCGPDEACSKCIDKKSL